MEYMESDTRNFFISQELGSDWATGRGGSLLHRLHSSSYHARRWHSDAEQKKPFGSQPEGFFSPQPAELTCRRCEQLPFATDRKPHPSFTVLNWHTFHLASL